MALLLWHIVKCNNKTIYTPTTVTPLAAAAAAALAAVAAVAPVILQCTDIDDTLVRADGDDSFRNDTRLFKEYWDNTVRPAGGILVLNTGRSIGLVTGLYEHMGEVMPWPNAIITAVGTQVGVWGKEGEREGWGGEGGGRGRAGEKGRAGAGRGEGGGQGPLYVSCSSNGQRAGKRGVAEEGGTMEHGGLCWFPLESSV